jgi:hypothetical protein
MCKKRLRPGGVFVMYNYFRQGWIVSRLQNTVREAFGSDALVLNLPSRDRLDPDDNLEGGFTMLIAGDNRAIRDAFARQPEYWLRLRGPFDDRTLNGFDYPLASERDAGARCRRGARRSQWQQFKLTQVNSGTESRLATDDWPMLYLREPMIPVSAFAAEQSWRRSPCSCSFHFCGAVVDHPRSRPGCSCRCSSSAPASCWSRPRPSCTWRCCSGGTWIVNSVVIFAVLVMILVANFFVAIGKPRRLAVHYAALLASLVVSALVPMDTFLGMDRAAQIAAHQLSPSRRSSLPA